MKAQNTRQQPQFFYGWVVLAASFLAVFATFGIRSSFGGYITSWEQEFAISRTAVSIISLVSLTVVAFSQPLVGKLNDRFGARTVLTVSMLLAGLSLLLCAIATRPWQLVLLYGVAASFAFTGASQITTTALMARWFTAKQGIAMGIATSGMAVGQLALVPVSLYLISRYNWRFSLGLLGLILIVVFTPLMAFLTRSKPEDIGLMPYGEQSNKIADSPPDVAGSETKTGSISVWTILKQRVFWLLSIPYFICGFTDVGLMNTHYIPFAQSKGFSLGIIAFTYSIIAVSNFFGAIGSGYLTDRFNRSRLLTLIFLARGLVFLFVLIADTPWQLTMFTLLYGLTDMASIAPTSSICAHLFSKHSFGVVIGVITVSHMLGGAIGSMVPGIIYDLAHSYVPVFGLSTFLLIIAAVVVSFVPDKRGVQKAIETTEV